MKPIIEIENVSKKYQIGTRASYSSLRDSFSQLFIARSKKKRDEFWALKDIQFKIAPGESLGVIGRNGAGKSTLLKILSQITPPTTGKITMRGRVASLLEVGTGFHPELTGRENIFLNGAILGMSRLEIKKKFDEIVDFAGIEQFLDTPVKRYSSGMYVRLAFAVAAHLEPEILIVDEVLAVGDAEFQKKCIGKMEEVTKKDGRTVLFVSHNLITIQSLCKTTVLLENGQIKKMGETKGVIDTYLNDRATPRSGLNNTVQLDGRGNAGGIRFTGVHISNTEGSDVLASDDKLKIVLKYSSDVPEAITDARIVMTIVSISSGQTVLRLDSDVAAKTIGQHLRPEGEIVCETDQINLAEGRYSADIDFLIQGTSQDHIKNAGEFAVVTDMVAYDYKIYPDNTVCDHVIKYWFK